MIIENTKLRESLIDLYVVQQKSYVQICKELHISMDTLHRTLKKLNIPARKRGGHRGKTIKKNNKQLNI